MIKFTLKFFFVIFLLFVFAYIQSESGNTAAIIVFLIIAVFIIGLIIASSNSKKVQERGASFTSKIKYTENFHPSRIVNGVDNLYQFSVDNTSKKILYLKGNAKLVIDYSKVISVHVVEDNTVISNKSLFRTVGGALIGGAIAGGAGMIVGGLTGPSKEKKKVSCVKVVIGLRDMKTPSLTINCFDAKTMTVERKQEIDVNGMEGYKYRQGASDAQTIASILSVIIDSMSNNKDNAALQDVSKNQDDVISQLERLGKLKEKGILSEEEFISQKEKLLSKQ